MNIFFSPILLNSKSDTKLTSSTSKNEFVNFFLYYYKNKYIIYFVASVISTTFSIFIDSRTVRTISFPSLRASLILSASF